APRKPVFSALISVSGASKQAGRFEEVNGAGRGAARNLPALVWFRNRSGNSRNRTIAAPLGRRVKRPLNKAAAESEGPIDGRIIPLIMCGGAGTRLWPASREVRPKQFLPLFGKRSTFQETLLRVSDAALFERAIVITNAAYRFMVLEQLAEIGLEADILLEPVRRDSGPAIATGAVFALTRGGDAVVLALAADHVVR